MLQSQRFSPDVEAAYQLQLGPAKVRAAFVSSGLCVLLFTAFGVVDLWAIASAVYEVWGIRLGLNVVAAGVAALAYWKPKWLMRWYTAVMSVAFLTLSAGVVGMILLAQPNELAYSAYFGGLIVISMALYACTYLQMRPAGAIGLAIAVMYFAAVLLIQDLHSTVRWPELLANGFFLLSANAIGLVTISTREKFSRRAHVLRVALQRDVIAREETHRNSARATEHDALTGLPNRMRFKRSLEQLIGRAKASKGKVALLFIDLDGFKAITDGSGHRAGDMVLCAVAERIRECVAPADLVARLGGDEFVAALRLRADQEPQAHARRVGQAIIEAVARPLKSGERHWQLSASVGVAISPEHGDDVSSLLEAADRQMYRAKRAGKSQVLVATLPAALTE